MRLQTAQSQESRLSVTHSVPERAGFLGPQGDRGGKLAVAFLTEVRASKPFVTHSSGSSACLV